MVPARFLATDADLLGQIRWTKSPAQSAWGGSDNSYPFNGRVAKTSKRLPVRSGKSFPAKLPVRTVQRAAMIFSRHTDPVSPLPEELPLSLSRRVAKKRAVAGVFRTGAGLTLTRRGLTGAIQGMGERSGSPFEYKKGESWDRLVHQGVHLLERFAQDDRVKILRPEQDLQVKMTRSLPGGNEFVSYLDAIGELDADV